ncbi:hypothetical protein [Parvularcula maris]|uniref:EF-hand domain-containing protein n=1 Tax=Parvularcula maris TaxID=2965077 RepID=A0A9X2RHM9_9PROT|nr:hypothetical protein [Parvularcula maris]MCQ8184096.1 hypothetical protein [Parvularcula maris]
MTKLAMILGTAAAASLFFAADASAQKERPEGPIAKEDMLEKVRERFEGMDANADGFIGSDEVGEGRRARFAQRMIEAQDKNEDGFVSLEEMLAAAEARFDRADADGDGILTEEEREAMRGDKPRRRGRRG